MLNSILVFKKINLLYSLSEFIKRFISENWMLVKPYIKKMPTLKYIYKLDSILLGK